MRLGVRPLAVFADQRDQTAIRLGLRNVVLDTVFTHVEVDLARRAADVAEVRVGHLARAVHDAAHDGDLYALEVAGLRADALRGRLQVEQRATAARAGDELGLRDTFAGALQDVVGQLRG